MTTKPDDIIDFWFPDPLDTPEAVDKANKRWFGGSEEFDDEIRERFADLPSLAVEGKLDDWQDSAPSTLALVLVLDQFPRNLYRGTPDSFAYDPLALEAAESAIERGFDRELEPIEAVFLYMPLEHSENLETQERCVALFRSLKDRVPDPFKPQFENFVQYAVRHHRIIERFGRFPHRNPILERAHTEEERRYLESGGDAF